ncbi:MAG TPA: DNA mismatch repair protein MutS [Candidatus Aphodocola excrementigallinarum]|uniref:DNA mismatch repair protein MutS n=1 Tax=Candidatus Aphodocola excrementigallinarum TaxID=2840670 RepID=A0A9D1IMN1_9FIRM|nr:DNA mismatch repair protein MutS [Candidatus Aphodocola excrementigallinarum]
MMRQYLEVKDNYEDVILFYRIGDFYEMFFDDAINVSRDLELTLTGKNAGLEERIPMCGVPHHAANMYINKLIEKGYKVAICEQTEDPKCAKGIVKREVIRIITKGTVMSDDMLDAKSNNYIGAIKDLGYLYALSYADLSTGEVNAVLVPYDTDKIINEIINYNIKELVVFDKLDPKITSTLKDKYQITISYENNDAEKEEYKNIYENVKDVRIISSLCVLLNYLTDTQKRSLEHMQKVLVRNYETYLKMDVHTKRNLELTENLRLKERTYSLLWLLDKTKTAMGSRLLKNMIENPITNKEELEKRYDMISKLSEEFLLKDELKDLLNEVYDLERLSGRVSFGNANARDLLQLKNSLKVLPRIKEIINELGFDLKINDLSDLCSYLDESLYEDPPVGLKEGYLIKEGFNKELDELKEARRGGKDFIAKLEEKERQRTGIKNLRVGYNRVFGYYIEVSKGNAKQVKEEFGYERKQTLANNERFITPELKEKERMILGAEEKIINLEYELFLSIREKVKGVIPSIQLTSKSLAFLDVIISFSSVSEDNNYVRPIITDKKEVRLIEARHPVVEKVLDGEFVANDIIISEDKYLELITGPNMGGKSTYMRQMAIIVIMAQIGCFVPCKEAVLPIFDQIFTRIGASDDLVAGESTFMVEMKEANNAIENASEKSLILFDELGRGTATYDGISLAQAIIEYIHDNIKAITLFSTHYHELTSLEEHKTHIKNVHVSAYEENGDITFLHKIEDGAADKSYGIHVAKLANLPASLIKRADEILKSYESEKNNHEVISQISMDFETNYETNDKYDIIKKKLDDVDPLNISPMQALNILYDLKKEMDKKD